MGQTSTIDRAAGYENGDRRPTPDGGAQVYGDGRWHDLHSPAGRRYDVEAEGLEAQAEPSNIEAEQGLLGALLCDREAVFAVDGLVKAEAFFEPFHRRLYSAIRDSATSGKHVSPALLAPRFERDEAFLELGGIEYLALLFERAPPSANAPDYARAVADASTRRQLVQAGKQISLLGFIGGEEGDELAAKAERLVAEATQTAGNADRWVGARTLIGEALAYAKGRNGVVEYSFGSAALDEKTGGMNAGEMTLLAARPGMGKTVGAVNVAKANASAGLGTCLYSLEMSANPLGLRLASDLAYDRRAPRHFGETTNPTADKAIKNKLTPEQWARMHQAEEIAADWPLLIDTRPGLTLAQIEASARRAHRRWARQGIKPGPVIIDHLGKVRPTTDRKGSKHAEVADISNGAAEMAKRLGVPVLALVQLNRGVEGRDDKRPMLSDLRQAGELEEDARQVLFLYRPEYYVREPTTLETTEQKTERLEKLSQVEFQLFWLIEKNSHGPRGQVLTFCDIACSAIRDWEP